MNQSFSKIWIIIILIILVAGGFFAWQYFGTPKEKTKTPEEKFVDETADWKTYRNEKYGFEIKYPLGYKISTETATDVGPAIKADSYAQIIFRDFTGYYTKEEIENIKKNSEKIKVGSLEAFKSSLGGNMDGGIELSIAFFDRPKKGMYLNILFSTHQPGREEELDAFNQMLSTFHFIEAEDETADLKTYRNEEYGFEVKYSKSLTTFGGADNGLSFPDGTKIYISTSKNLSVLLPGTFGGHLTYTEISPPQSFVFTEEYLNFYKDYFIAYAGMSSWDTVINARQYKNGVFYIISLNAEFVKGTPDTSQKKEELINSALSEMKNGNNEYVKVFNQMLSTFRFLE